MIWFWLIWVTTLLCYTACSLHRALCSLIQTEISCIQKQMTVNRPFKGFSTKGPWQRNVLPSQVCCSADFLTFWTCYRSHPLTEAFESRVLVCVLVTAAFDHTVIFIALSYTDHSAAAAPSQTDSRSLVCLVFKYNKYQTNSINLIWKKETHERSISKMFLWSCMWSSKDKFLGEFHSKIFLLEISMAGFL